LQKILQSMENLRAPRSAPLTYAILSLVVRLVASQAAVFSLWFGRRAYERSRGEMITMLYEKTLSRKVVSVSSKARIEDNSRPIPAGAGKQAELSPWGRVLRYLVMPFRSLCGPSHRAKAPDKSSELASMGKILNLMRQVSKILR